MCLRSYRAIYVKFNILSGCCSDWLLGNSFCVEHGCGCGWIFLLFVTYTYWLSIRGRSTEFINGMVASEDVLYFLIVISLFLSLSILRLKAIRQKTSLKNCFQQICGVTLIAVLLGYISSRPVMMFYFDATRTKVNTLTPNSQKIVAQMDGGLTINSYVNILDRFYYRGCLKVS